jgi:epoxyqueuosine reductase
MDPHLIMPDAKSVVVCAMNYNTGFPRTTFSRLKAWISRYAWGLDYHDVLKVRTRELARWIEANFAARTRAYVDTGPLNERVLAKYAGIGWFGKNTCIINQHQGSWLFLGCILTNLDIQTDMPPPDRCGSCTRCLDACPTDAFVAPYILDSRKCISYTTIELRGPIPEESRTGVGHHLFGCDICQDVCPWNRRAPETFEPQFQPRPGLFHPEIETLLALKESQWQELIRHTPLKRAKVKGLMRNLMVVAGNSGVARFAASLEKFRTHDDEQVRTHASWAIEQLKRKEGERPSQ